jgi:transposase
MVSRAQGDTVIVIGAGKVRLNHSGNRTVNTTLHMNGHPGPQAGPRPGLCRSADVGGKTRTEAVRLLRRRLSDMVFTALRADEQARSTSTQTSHAAASARAA